MYTCKRIKMDKKEIIKNLLNSFSGIRYVAIYKDGELDFNQKAVILDNSSTETDRFEELLVNPTLLTLAEQRGNIDCGGLRHIIVRYGNFYQLIKKISNGHISICLEKNVDLNKLPTKILDYIRTNHAELG